MTLLDAAAWVHRAYVRDLVSQAVTDALNYPSHDLTIELRHHDLTIELRQPSEADGCWCYAYGKGLDVRPHAHDPGLGKCPPTIAHDNYVMLRMGE